MDTDEDTTTVDEPISSDVYAVALARMHEPSESPEGAGLLAAFVVAIRASLLAGALTLAGWFAKPEALARLGLRVAAHDDLVG